MCLLGFLVSKNNPAKLLETMYDSSVVFFRGWYSLNSGPLLRVPHNSSRRIFGSQTPNPWLAPGGPVARTSVTWFSRETNALFFYHFRVCRVPEDDRSPGDIRGLWNDQGAKNTTGCPGSPGLQNQLKIIFFQSISQHHRQQNSENTK